MLPRSTSCLFRPGARTAFALAFALSGVLFVPRMPVFAMSAGEFDIPASASAKGKTVKVDALSETENIGQWEAIFGPRLDGVSLLAAHQGKIGGTVGLPLNLDADSYAAIELVFSTGGPSTVSRLVVAVIVDSVDYSALRAWPHIGKPQPETIPAVANGDPATSIVFPLLEATVEAPRSHRFPNVVERMLILKGHLTSYASLYRGGRKVSNPI